MRLLVYLAFGVLALLLQSALFPLFLPLPLRPDLLLILVVVIARCERSLPGIPLVFLLGLLADSAAGIYSGLHPLVYGLLFVPLRYAVRQLNSESLTFLLLMVIAGTFLHGGQVVFWLGIFADAGSSGFLVLQGLLVRVAVNLMAALLLVGGNHLLGYLGDGRLQFPCLQLGRGGYGR